MMSKFYKRMELIRTTYNLTTRELAMILNIKAPSITMWEKAKAPPTHYLCLTVFVNYLLFQVISCWDIPIFLIMRPFF